MSARAEGGGRDGTLGGGVERGQNFIAKFGRYVSIIGASEDIDKKHQLMLYPSSILYISMVTKPIPRQMSL
jgi:hypothetical protein